MVKHILIATKNAGKAREFKKLFSEKGIEVKTLLDMENTPEIEENGKTFTENALIKAQTLTNLYKIPVLADDSGIVVDYLNGEPKPARTAAEQAVRSGREGHADRP